jgi:hypothetical protein
MGLLELWNLNRGQIEDKRLHQLIAFAGDGRLLDGGPATMELRQLLAAAPSARLARWKDEALEDRYDGFGFVLQDLVNEVGRRLGFKVEFGRYRGRSGEDSADGIWTAKDGHILLVESKTSSSHRIELSRLAEWRRRLTTERRVSDDRVSSLIVIAEEETEELEAQVRGSRSAWELRLLGVDALFKLLSVRESLDDDQIENQIQSVLVPQEFTRLDKIIDLVFATKEDAEPQVEVSVPEVDGDEQAKEPNSNFHDLVLPRLEDFFRQPLVRRSRVVWAFPDDTVAVSCQVSRRYDASQGQDLYWYGLKRTTRDKLSAFSKAWCAFALGRPDQVVLLPYEMLATHLDGMFTSPDDSGGILHWHVRLRRGGTRIDLLTHRDSIGVDVTQFQLPKTPKTPTARKG